MHASRRFGPAKAEEVLPLVTRFVAVGGWIVSDRLRAYRSNLSALGYKHIALNHSDAEFVHPTNHDIHSQTMEGAWADMKTHFRAMHGVLKGRAEDHLYEWMWRRNTQAASACPFHSLLLLLGKKN